LIAMLERHLAIKENYATLLGHVEHVSRTRSELAEAMTASRYLLIESRHLIAKADAILARKFPTARFTMRNTPGRTQWEIEELNRRFEMCMAKLHPRDRELLADWFAGWMAVDPNFGPQ
jgi:hypothetical protein